MMMTDTIVFQPEPGSPRIARAYRDGIFTARVVVEDGSVTAVYDACGYERCIRDAARETACTLCRRCAADRVPWSGERLCWPCTDTQLDLLAKVVQDEVLVTARAQ